MPEIPPISNRTELIEKGTSFISSVFLRWLNSIIDIIKTCVFYNFDGTLTIDGDTTINGTIVADDLLTGEYTPTLNARIGTFTTLNSYPAYYERRGDYVTVYGTLNMVCTSTGTASVTISLPISSTFTSRREAFGTMSPVQSNPTINYTSLGIFSAQTTNLVEFSWKITSSSNYDYRYSFRYKIL